MLLDVFIYNIFDIYLWIEVLIEMFININIRNRNIFWFIFFIVYMEGIMINLMELCGKENFRDIIFRFYKVFGFKFSGTECGFFRVDNFYS